jgi:hypothetical protein
MPVGCIFKSTHYTILLTYTLLPLFISGLLISWYLRLSKKEDERSINLRNKLFELVLALTFLILPSVSIKIFSTFSCQDFDDRTSHLKVDYNLDCKADNYGLFKAYAWIMVMIYPVGIPLGYFIMLFRVRRLLKAGQIEKENVNIMNTALEKALEERANNEANNPTLKALSFLYSSYQPKYWWFEIFETLRKLSLTGFMVFMAPGTAGQVVISLVMSITALAVNLGLGPYKEVYNNHLSLVSNIQLVVTLIGALAMKANLDEANLSKSSTFDIFMTSVQFVPVLLLSIYILMVARKATKKKERMSSIVPVLTSQRITQISSDISPEDQTQQHAQEDKQFIEYKKISKFRQEEGISGNATYEEFLQYKEAQGEEKEEIS